jgi:hypothetical protein
VEEKQSICMELFNVFISKRRQKVAAPISEGKMSLVEGRSEDMQWRGDVQRRPTAGVERRLD